MYLPRLRKLSDAYEEIKRLDPETALTFRQLRSMAERRDLTILKYNNAWVVNMDELFAHFTTRGVTRCINENFWQNEFATICPKGSIMTLPDLCILFQNQDSNSLIYNRNLRKFLQENDELYIALNQNRWFINFPEFYRKINPLGVCQKETLPRIRGQISALKLIKQTYPKPKIKKEYLLQILQMSTVKKYQIGEHWLINYDEFEQEFLRHFYVVKKTN